MDAQETPWYRDGLRFSCTQCGNCCTGAPGYVWVDPEEIARLAGSLGLETEAFSRKYVRRVGNRLSLIERANGDCVFWRSDQGCTVYDARPVQCRTWPFWEENLETPADWKRVQRGCPGAGTGDFFPLEAIEDAVRRTPQ
jgi:Fe-S-cluster containining protein